VTAEAIYRFLLAEQKAGGELSLNLRQRSKSYRKRYGSNDYRGQILGRVSIDDRPAIVDEKSRLGDWEADLVVGTKGQGARVTLAERRSQLYLALPTSMTMVVNSVGIKRSLKH
jgi:IS30 family transposase